MEKQIIDEGSRENVWLDALTVEKYDPKAKAAIGYITYGKLPHVIQKQIKEAYKEIYDTKFLLGLLGYDTAFNFICYPDDIELYYVEGANPEDDIDEHSDWRAFGILEKVFNYHAIQKAFFAKCPELAAAAKDVYDDQIQYRG